MDAYGNPHTRQPEDQGLNNPHLAMNSTISQDRTDEESLIEQHLSALEGKLSGRLSLNSVQGLNGVPNASLHNSPIPPAQTPIIRPVENANAAQANALLMQAGINPNFLSAAQLESFHAQNPSVQKKSIQVYAQNMATQRHAGSGGMPYQTQAGISAQQEYEMQLLLLEQQNKQRLLMSKKEREPRGVPQSQTQTQRQKIPAESPMVSSPMVPSPFRQRDNIRNTQKGQDSKNGVSSAFASAITDYVPSHQNRMPLNMPQDHDIEDTAKRPDCTASSDMYSPRSTLPRHQQARMLTNNSSQGDSEVVVAEAVMNKSYQGPPTAISPNDSHLHLVTSLRATIEKLEIENETLQKSIVPPPPKWQVLHRVSCDEEEGLDIFLDVPLFLSNGDRESHLQGRLRISDVELYCERHPDISFVVYKDYICDDHDHRVRKKRAAHGRGKTLVAGAEQEPSKSGESLSIVSHILCEALSEAADEDLQKGKRYPAFDVYSEIPAPYLFYYHDRASFKRKVASTRSEYREHLDLFINYVDESFGKEYKEADELFSRGMVSARYVKYLFVPNTVLVSCAKDQYMAHVLESWPEWKSLPLDNLSANQEKEPAPEGLVEVSSWDFDGSFQKVKTKLLIRYETLSVDVRSIRDLDIYPLRYAEPKVEKLLRDRGRKFWQCRSQKYVSYNGSDVSHEEDNIDVRYMIDIVTYRKMHPEAKVFSRQLKDELGPKKMAQDEPPGGDFSLLLPANVHGFNMQEKKWVNLQVDLISPIKWNKQAFESLVVEDDTKELIIALVTNQLVAERATDLVGGKGNGLIVLLHGGPGTGKTLTAESVAEIAEKPLYRVTCGDIGTDPVAVEKYLATVLHLGKIWDCVVLLDEADVFLEQRTLADLQRNALVSVFLRVLEYYDGILILTSNRVGTFDEAFKSRIQLALHYENLTPPQRKKIWANFLSRLEDMEGDKVNVGDVRRHINELAKHNMNGRQIRNALTTARQLALYKKTSMDYGHLKHVINVAGKFDRYLLQVKEGTTDDQWAREEGVR